MPGFSEWGQGARQGELVPKVFPVTCGFLKRGEERARNGNFSFAQMPVHFSSFLEPLNLRVVTAGFKHSGVFPLPIWTEPDFSKDVLMKSLN